MNTLVLCLVLCVGISRAKLHEVRIAEEPAKLEIHHIVKRGAGHKCHFRFGEGDVIVKTPRDGLFEVDGFPCLKWKCKRGEKVKLRRRKSGCPYKDKCIPFLESTGEKCDMRKCRFKLHKNKLKYGLVTPFKKAQCEYEGKCYDIGDEVKNENNCTYSMCDALPRYNRFGRKSLWIPSRAGCVINGKCYENNETLVFGTCLKHRCNASIKMEKKRVKDEQHYHFHGQSKLDPIIEGCETSAGKCVKVGGIYKPTACIVKKCVRNGNTFSFETESKENGCSHYWDTKDDTCYKVGESFNSPVEWGQSKGCPGAAKATCVKKGEGVKLKLACRT